MPVAYVSLLSQKQNDRKNLLDITINMLFSTHALALKISVTHSLMAHSLEGTSRPPSTTRSDARDHTVDTGTPCAFLFDRPRLNAGGFEVFSIQVEHGGSLRCPWPPSAIDGQETVGPCGRHDQREHVAVAQSSFQCEKVQCDEQPQCFLLCGTNDVKNLPLAPHMECLQLIQIGLVMHHPCLAGIQQHWYDQ